MTNSVATKLECEYCGGTFKLEWRFDRHMCDRKRRWLDQGKPANRIAYEAWSRFYQFYHPRIQRQYRDFISNTYYNAFLTWGTYCVEIGATAPDQYARYLLDNNVPIDRWTSDTHYTKYITGYLRRECALDAVRRSMDYLLSVCDSENCRLVDVWRLCGANKLCQAIARGQISPWVLYNHPLPQDWLSRLNDDQRAYIYEYIEPQSWAILFRHSITEKRDVEALLSEAFG